MLSLIHCFQVTVLSIVMLAVAYAAADKPPPSYAEPAYSEPASYSYSWAVKDDYSKNDYGQDEKREGANTSGSYQVLLPDGRVQKVTYTVDAYNGKQLSLPKIFRFCIENLTNNIAILYSICHD